MTDSCNTCFAYRSGRCNRDAPSVPFSGSTSQWPQVKSTDWCGDGADVTTGAPFLVLAVTTFSGSFTFAAGTNTKTVTNANCNTRSRIVIWVTSYVGTAPASIVAIPAAGTFEAKSQNGDNIECACAYTIFNG